MSFDQDADGPVGESYGNTRSRTKLKRAAFIALLVVLLVCLVCGAGVLLYYLLRGAAR